MRTAPGAALLALLAVLAADVGVRVEHVLAEQISAPAPPAPRIVNGSLAGNYATVGALLSGNNPNTATLNCTGTMIGCETMLTAAHCFCPATGAQCQPPSDPDPSQVLVYLQNAGFFSVDEILVHPDYDFPVADLAIVKLAAPVDGIRPMRINLVTPGIPQTGTIVGYGRTGGGSSNTDFGIKREGTVVTTSCISGLNAELLCWDFLGPNSNTCGGDSGGPMFIDFGAGEELVGVTSGGLSFSCLPDDHGFDVNVANYATWVLTTGGPDLGNTSCGAGPQVGDPDVLTIEHSGILVGAGATDSLGFSLSAGSDQLRVAYNGHDSEESNFDLLVKRGAPPTQSDFDCKQDGAGQYGFCQFDSPAGGQWFTRVDQIEGSGQFQVTVTNIGAEPPVCGNAVKEPGEDCDDTDATACEGLCLGNCTCPAPVCGNNVEEAGESCDGTAEASCVAGCGGDCVCSCLIDKLIIKKAQLDRKRLSFKTFIDNSGGELTGLDPRLAFSGRFADDVGEVSINIPGGDPGWLKSKPSKGRFKWKGEIGGLKGVVIRDKTDKSGEIQLRIKGKEILGSDDFNDDKPLSVEVEIDGVCAASLCGDGLLNETTGEQCDETVQTATCDGDCTFPACGDGTTNTFVGEVCDDGGESATCDLDCSLAECGDGTLNLVAGEQCDDANMIETDPCPISCILAACGDGFHCSGFGCTSGPTGGAEECDNGPSNSNTTPDACRTTCALPSCGDVVTDTGEFCDDGIETPVCDDDCTDVTCGDGNSNEASGEICDDGGESADCDPDCTSVVCGDAYVNTSAGEECDDQNANFNDPCPTTCKDAVCGDGFLCTFPGCVTGPGGGTEECDDGAGNSDSTPDACRTDCSSPICGDLIVDAGQGEACDEGGGETATCDADCSSVICGDGTVNGAAGEQCDDQNISNNDPCVAGCVDATCGDGFTCNGAGCTTGPGAGFEECDQGASNSDTEPDACRTDCSNARCGDNVIDQLETCDDGNTTPGDGCDENCQTE